MIQDIKIFTSAPEIDREQWQRLVVHSATSSFFQTPECLSFYDSAGCLDSFVFGVSQDDTLVGIMCGYCVADGKAIKRFFSRRAIVPGGLLLNENISKEALQKLLVAAQQKLRSNAIYIEIRNYNDYSVFRNHIEFAGFDYHPHLNFHVDTTNIVAAYNRLSSSKRRQLKLSEKSGAYYHVTTDSDDIRAFYSILTELYSDKLRIPLFPFVFFEELLKIQPSKLIVVKKDNVVIGGILCICHDYKAVYEWFVCGVELIDVNIYPSVVATWAGIEYAALNGFSRFDFMGAGKPDKSYGVREFKSKFGGELIENGRFVYVCNPVLYKIGNAGLKLLRKGYFK
jgi:serine/alanine adding enzyme